MYIQVELRPCPWCRSTPDIYMPIYADTWLWTIQCRNPQCDMTPTSPHVSIRKRTKKEFILFYKKIELLAQKWNSGNPFQAFEMKVINLSPIHELEQGAKNLFDMGDLINRIKAK